MDGEGRPLRSKRQVNFCHLWRLGLKSHVSMSRTPLLTGLGTCGTRFCLSQSLMSKCTGQLGQAVLGSGGWLGRTRAGSSAFCLWMNLSSPAVALVRGEDCFFNWRIIALQCYVGFCPVCVCVWMHLVAQSCLTPCNP